MMKLAKNLLLSFPLALGAACAGPGADEPFQKADDFDGDGKADSSVVATIMDFEFDGEVLTDSSWNPESTIRDQLLYTIGHLNENNSVGRLDRLELSNVRTEDVGDKTLIRYHAKMPVAWGSKTNLPSSYGFKLPKDLSYSAQEAFASKYAHDCVDFGAHDVDAGSMWYYYRPEASRCQLAAEDIVEIESSAVVSTVNTTGKYPEYHKVWEDDVLNVVAIYGKYEDGATTSSDAGIAAYNSFVSAMKSTLSGATTTPASIPSAPGVGTPDVSFEKDLGGGKKVKVTALLVDNVRTAGAAFDARYAALSTRADIIIYAGHAGLGANVRALARKGQWVAGQYVIVFMNGCDTFAYVDGYMAETRATLNPDDPTGTKYMEIVTNAMPSYFSNMAGASSAFVRGLMAHDAPKTYEQIFRSISSTQVVLVTGESDNVYVPGFGGGGGGGGGTDGWAGLDESGSLAKSASKKFETPELAPGKYVFEITGTGDADLYVRIGSAPTTSTFDCRPYRSGSEETCEVNLPSAAKIHVMVRGYTAATYTLTGKKQ